LEQERADALAPPFDRFDLTGRVALVTGGTRGLGRAIVRTLALAGADVVVSSRKQEACDDAAEEVRRAGRRALAHVCHVGRWSEIDALVEAAYAEFGRIDVLVNNAGLAPTYPNPQGVTEELWDKTLAVNLKGPFRLTSLVLALLAVISPGNFVPGSELAKGFGPLLVGIIVAAIGLSLGGPTGYAINPARDLGLHER